MDEENKFYLSLFVIFSGFMLFIFAFMNKQKLFFPTLDKYYVLLVLAGIFTGIFGASMMLAWHVRNRKPFEDTFTKTHFPSFFAIGALLLFSGLSFYFFYAKGRVLVFEMSMTASIMGIILLMLGLRYYVQEALFAKKMQKHF
ncbi:MAG: hypothetical protein ABIJ34_03155 [archaeon]